MKSTALETFLFGVTLGAGMVVLSLYTRKPSCLVTSLETIAEMGRAQRAKEEKKRLQLERLKAIGFSDQEIDEIL